MRVTIETIKRRYDGPMFHPRTREYYDESDFFNFGYWLEATRDPKEACENLMEKLLEFIPEKKGTIVDVACGLGATTRYLLKYYNTSDVVGINVSMKQLEASRLNAPGCRFMLMDAAKLAFGDGLFDNMICVEAVFHFDTRESFLHEAWRVLKPGGHLVLSDIVFPKWVWKWNPYVPEKNFVKDLEEYRDIYLQAGFQDVEIVHATTECWKGFRKHVGRWQRMLLRRADLRTLGISMLRTLGGTLTIKHYLLVSARKA